MTNTTLIQRISDSFLSQDAEAVSENYADDAVLYGPNGEISPGRNSCRMAFVAMFKAFEVTLRATVLLARRWLEHRRAG